MSKSHRLRLIIIVATLAVITAGLTIYLKQDYAAAWSPGNYFNLDKPSDHTPGSVITIYDQNGNMISKAARSVSTGDEIFTAQGRHYRVEKIKGKTATARFLELDRQFLAYSAYYGSLALPVAVNPDWKDKAVGIYHTHSDESYVPSDGRESIPYKGGIYQVGESLVNKLKGDNVSVEYDRTPHEPHDNNAYYRSRRTAVRLVKQGVASIVDVHRDGIPDPSYYRRVVSNEDIAQLRLVIGRQNPNMQANLDFAKRMMAYANKTHPNVVKEIFLGRGNYNQDLLPTALLIEAGTHTNDKASAEKGVTLFADAIPVVLGLGTPGAPGGGLGQAGGAWKALAWVIGIALVGGLGFLVVSSGGLKQAKEKLSGFVNREFTGLLGPVRRRGSGFAGKSRKEPDGEEPPR